MALTSKLWFLIALVLAAGTGACHPRPSSAPPERCGPTVPGNAEHPVAVPAVKLAGDYDLMQVRTQPSPGSRSGRLHLMPVDSATRAAAVGGAVRDLIGWLDPLEPDSGWRADADSRDPAQPGAVLAGSHLRLGQPALDAYVEHLTITAVSSEGFWGWWKGEPGFLLGIESKTGRRLPDPAGYFCALRVQP